MIGECMGRERRSDNRLESVKKCENGWNLRKQWLREGLLFCYGILLVKSTWLMVDKVEGMKQEVGRGEERKMLKIEENELAVFIRN